jgi:predicted aspartyl protease
MRQRGIDRTYISSRRVTLAIVAALVLLSALPVRAQDYRAAGGIESFSGLEGELLAEVPIEVDGEWLIVPVEARGRTYRFILDTGATTGAISRSLALQLGLRAVAEAKLSGASGQARVPVVTTKMLRLGDARAGSWEKYVLGDEVLADGDDHRFDGIVGSDLLKYYDVLIDAPGRALRLYKRGTTDQDSGPVVGPDDAVPFERVRRGIIRFEVHVNGSAVDAVLDSGSPVLLLNPTAADATGVTVTDEPVSEQSRGIGSEEVPTYGARIASIRVGRTSLEVLDGEVADLPIFGRLGLDDRPGMLLGSPFLLRCPLLISWSARELRFCRQAVGPKEAAPESPIR